MTFRPDRGELRFDGGPGTYLVLKKQ